METIKIKGVVNHKAWDKHGNLLFDDTEENLITNAGKGEITNLLGNVSSPAYFTYLANGSSATAAAATDTTLNSENSTNGFARAAATVTRQTTTTTNDTLQLVKTWTASGSVTVNEVGIFNASSSGVLLGHQVLASTKTFSSGDTYQLTYKVIFA